MKNKTVNGGSLHSIAFIAIVAVIGFSMVSCEDVVDEGNWTTVKSPFGNDYYDDYDGIQVIAYGNGRFVAVNHNKEMAYSSDGKTWTNVTDSPITVRAITYGGDKFVAVGSGIMYSSDGITWTETTGSDDSIFGPHKSFRSIAYGNGKFVAGGALLGGGIQYSSDGITWTYAEGDTIGTIVYSIASGNGTFVAGDYGRMAYSSDGEEWTRVTDDDSTFYAWNSIQAIAYGNGNFVAWGDSGIDSSGGMAYSSDGVTWARATDSSLDPLSDSVSAIAYGNGKFVAISYDKTAYSSDGVKWKAGEEKILGVTSGGWREGVESINAIAFGNGIFVIGGMHGKIAYSK